MRNKYIILVGGFGESPYLKKKLVELFDRHGSSVVTAEEPSSVEPIVTGRILLIFHFSERRQPRELLFL